MNNPNSEIFSIFQSLLIQHIATKTVNSQFHEKSQEFYEFAFDCFHLIGEKDQDIGEMEPIKEDDAINQTYKDVEDLKNLLIAMSKERNSVGKDNLIRSLIDRAEGVCGNARAFIKDEEEDITESIMSKLPDRIPMKTIKVPRNY